MPLPTAVERRPCANLYSGRRRVLVSVAAIGGALVASNCCLWFGCFGLHV